MSRAAWPSISAPDLREGRFAEACLRPSQLSSAGPILHQGGPASIRRTGPCLFGCLPDRAGKSSPAFLRMLRGQADDPTNESLRFMGFGSYRHQRVRRLAAAAPLSQRSPSILSGGVMPRSFVSFRSSLRSLFARLRRLASRPCGVLRRMMPAGIRIRETPGIWTSWPGASTANRRLQRNVIARAFAALYPQRDVRRLFGVCSLRLPFGRRQG